MVAMVGRAEPPAAGAADIRGTDPSLGCQVSMAFGCPSPGIVPTRIARMTIAYALAILFLSSADFSFEWRAVLDDSTLRNRGVGLAVGYFGGWEGLSQPWEVGSQPAGLKARLHAPDFGFAGATLVARGPESRAFLIAPWSALSVAWFAHLAWALTRKRRA